ncbi:MAG TPA: LexA family transcriptional regulator [Clostridiaceae bacterium]|nr:LexA family transcriptional regulator [Clostridiaceae bacterium]
MSFNFDSLTSKQKKVYMIIESYIRSNGIPPTVREIGELMGEKTPGAVQGILNRLELKGALKRQVGIARSIQLVPRDASLYSEPVFIPEIKKITKRNIDNLFDIYNIHQYLPLPSEIVENDNNHFIIRCPNDDLLKSNICPGDILIIKMEYKLNEGDIALIFYNDRIILRKYYTVNGQEKKIILKADNSIIRKESFYLSEIIIIGKVVGKISKI